MYAIIILNKQNKKSLAAHQIELRGPPVKRHWSKPVTDSLKLPSWFLQGLHHLLRRFAGQFQSRDSRSDLSCCECQTRNFWKKKKINLLLNALKFKHIEH
jgi:hypothetical protein